MQSQLCKHVGLILLIDKGNFGRKLVTYVRGDVTDAGTLPAAVKGCRCDAFDMACLPIRAQIDILLRALGCSRPQRACKPRPNEPRQTDAKFFWAISHHGS
jgi:hypothetical protein